MCESENVFLDTILFAAVNRFNVIQWVSGAMEIESSKRKRTNSITLPLFCLFNIITTVVVVIVIVIN